MVTWVVFGLMAGAVLAAFRAAWVEVFARNARRAEVLAQHAYMARHEEALTWAFRAAGCLVALSLGGLWRVAQAVTR